MRGGLQPLGVIDGMVRRRSRSARLSLFQPLDWLRVSRLLCGLGPMPPADKFVGETAAESENVVNPEAFYERLRVWQGASPTWR